MSPPHPSSTSDASHVQVADGAVPLAVFWALIAGAGGILTAFLPAFFQTRGIPAGRIGILLALQPLMTLVSPPIFGFLSDRTGRPGRVMTLIAFGCALGFLPLWWARGFLPIVAAMAIYAFFASSLGPLTDAMILQRVSKHGGNYAHIRLWGSLGFVLTTTVFGLWVAQVDDRVIAAPLVIMAVYALWSLTLRTRAKAAPARIPFEGVFLLKERQLAILLAASCLHWISAIPYHGTFGMYVLAIGLPPRIVGAAFALGTLSEVGVMVAYPTLAARFRPRHLLFLSFFASALRWAGYAVATQPWQILPLSTLHAFTYGTFWLSAIAYLTRRVPESMRATGQALFASFAFGLAGLVGFLTALPAYQLLGGQRLFWLAAVLELVPMWLMTRVGEPPAHVAVEPA